MLVILANIFEKCAPFRCFINCEIIICWNVSILYNMVQVTLYACKQNLAQPPGFFLTDSVMCLVNVLGFRGLHQNFLVSSKGTEACKQQF